ncbi:STM4015 family protein [Streptomyces carpinensis]|uniref:STM4015 family protein n=1 Tax=Streptomyces carpinensis TaxID=66369 RepID=A0ABV1WAV1_9ACTN|nr:STM4015 family protein [Streptomyces carpinensis]
MSYYPSHLTGFHGLPVHDFTLPDHDGPESGGSRPGSREAVILEPADGARGASRPAPGSVAWRLSALWQELPFDVLWRRFLEEVPTEEVTALVVGAWWEEYDEHGIDPVLDVIVAEAHRFPRLRAVFLADVESEETEISWIKQGDVTKLLRAWPRLEELAIRGAEDLVVEPLRHEGLRTLRVECGGLPREVVRALGGCAFPALDRLDLWLGTVWYGGDCAREDVDALLVSLGGLPRLRHLGLRNSDIQDDIAAAVAAAPVVAGLHSLNLSMGALGDDGGGALLAGQPLTHLKSLNLNHHFMSEALTGRLSETLAPHGVDLALAPARRLRHAQGRYVAVGE